MQHEIQYLCEQCLESGPDSVVRSKPNITNSESKNINSGIGLEL